MDEFAELTFEARDFLDCLKEVLYYTDDKHTSARNIIEETFRFMYETGCTEFDYNTCYDILMRGDYK